MDINSITNVFIRNTGSTDTEGRRPSVAMETEMGMMILLQKLSNTEEYWQPLEAEESRKDPSAAEPAERDTAY